LIDEQKEFLYAFGDSPLIDISQDDGRYTNIQLGNCGAIQIDAQLEMSQSTDIFKRVMEWSTVKAEEQIIQKIVEQVIYHFMFLALLRFKR
jgi:hypothetical protein